MTTDSDNILFKTSFEKLKSRKGISLQRWDPKLEIELKAAPTSYLGHSSVSCGTEKAGVKPVGTRWEPAPALAPQGSLGSWGQSWRREMAI